jgi:hypothetical protein
MSSGSRAHVCAKPRQNPAAVKESGIKKNLQSMTAMISINTARHAPKTPIMPGAHSMLAVAAEIAISPRAENFATAWTVSSTLCDI